MVKYPPKGKVTFVQWKFKQNIVRLKLDGIFRREISANSSFHNIYTSDNSNLHNIFWLNFRYNFPPKPMRSHGFPQVGFFFFSLSAPEKKVSHCIYVSFGELISKINPYSWIGEARIEFGVPFCSLFFKLLIYLPLNYCTISIFSVYVNFTEIPCYLAAWALYGFLFGKTGTFYEPEKSNWRKKCKQCKANKNDDTNGNGNEMKRCQKGDCLVC